MTLQELKIASYLMIVFSDQEKSYKKIAAKNFDLAIRADCTILLKFLNEWGCRQFKLDNHNEAAKGLTKWYKKASSSLPNQSSLLIDQSGKKIKEYCKIFDELRLTYASTDKRGVIKTVGPVGAAKTLFALRKNTFPPWDNPIIDKFEFSKNGEGYTNYLLQTKEELQILKTECKSHNIDIRQIPEILNRQHASLVKFIDEYYWLTITRNCNPTSIIELTKTAANIGIAASGAGR